MPKNCHWSYQGRGLDLWGQGQGQDHKSQGLASRTSLTVDRSSSCVTSDLFEGRRSINCCRVHAAVIFLHWFNTKQQTGLDRPGRAVDEQCVKWKTQHWMNILVSVWSKSLIFIARQHIDARYWYSKSVRPSVTFRYQMKTAWHIVIVFFSPYDSPIFLVLPASNIFTEFRRDHPLRGR